MSFLTSLADLNARYTSTGRTVNELYGSLRSDVAGFASARPDFRLPEVSLEEFRNFINAAHGFGFRINYTANAPLNRSIDDMVSLLPRWLDWLNIIVDIGVDKITVANSLLLEQMVGRINAEIEISSLLHPRAVSHVPVYTEYGVSSACLDVVRNRDLSFVRNFAEFGRNNGIETKVIVNEMCNINGAPCSGVLQSDCVIHSSLGGNQARNFDGWPFSRCFSSRMSPSSWLKARFILPEWINAYKETTSVTNFKITGRTCPEHWLLTVVESYLKGQHEGDIRSLWFDPGSFHGCERNFNDVITTDMLQAVRFFDKWRSHSGFRCDDVCGYTCTYCDDIANRLTKRV